MTVQNSTSFMNESKQGRRKQQISTMPLCA